MNRRRNSFSRESSLPKNWPNSTSTDIAANPNRVVVLGGEQRYSFKSNFVKTSKYEVWNFLPKFLMEEFNPKTKVANCYFLLVSALQCIPSISNTFGYPTTLLPLIVVVVVDAIFAIIEDYGRHKADTEANGSMAQVYSPTESDFVEMKWADICVGDFVYIKSREKIPADVVILSVAEKTKIPAGICYVETKSLDGETNLKIRNAMSNTLAVVNSTTALSNVAGEITMEHPNKLIDTFNGVLSVDGMGREAIMANHVLLRGCVLRNTDWVIGVVVNSGHDTKIMMSATATPSKTSFLEHTASSEIQRIIVLLAFVCLVGSTGATIWNDTQNVENMWYLDWDPSPGSYWVIQFFYFFLLHATFIPVSLYVSMTLIRFFQSYFMNNDLEMYYERTDTPSVVRTMTLNEELGQISHVFSDKTGTLTCNVMDFRKASINGVSYGLGITEIGKASWKLQGKSIPDDILCGEENAKKASVPHVSFYDPKYDADVARGGTQKESIQQFFRILSLCHDTIPERIDDKIKLSASNPDDEALLCAASYFGFEFRDRRSKTALVFNKEENVMEEIEVLETIAFTSKRKRMSVIVKYRDGSIQLLCKGADSTMVPRLHEGQDDLLAETDDHMRLYSVEGLRCLLVGYKNLSPEEFSKFSAHYNEVATNMEELEKRKEGMPNLIEEAEDEMEQGLTLVGCTAIEDKLQDGVPEAIAQIAKAGINIWVLTGDKEETAINIAVACNLVLPQQYMRHVIVNKKTCPTPEKIRELLEAETKHCEEDIRAHEQGQPLLPRALIIDGPSLIGVMMDEAAKRTLLEFSKICKAVVGCRVSPDQKREMVNMIKTGVEGVRTLSIGDGANDVAMIQEAHIGVGIRGEEGIQATNASDYAIAQFRYLAVLLLKHGRYNYIRMCALVCYMFYKNIFMSICQFWFAWLNGFSGQKIYTEAGIQMYNLLFTSIPILLSGIYDMDIPPNAVYTHPELYASGISNEYFTPWVFWDWILHAVGESLICTFFPPLFLHNSSPRSGTYETFWESGAMTFTVVVIIVNLKMVLIQSKWMLVNVIFVVASVASWFGIAYLVTNVELVDYEWYQIWSRLMYNGNFWLGSLIIVFVILGKDLYVLGIQRSFLPKSPQIIQEIYILNPSLISTDGGHASCRELPRSTRSATSTETLSQNWLQRIFSRRPATALSAATADEDHVLSLEGCYADAKPHISRESTAEERLSMRESELVARSPLKRTS
mmetsp:Transcript_9092/g.13680  ORF Transcript_9092/g.13680 Transcript_9092/m.13680 type:complete len:1228 (+) Transcript_9092:73-3756(+)|eukprot:CAMPEP_0185038810 /NCGR_PEP_ID=MMETSP1103-20130426/34927_1 /TAXON_ID=36769 /ORGANISM="Paraphysomonas bandaiensis, Strain Caron Lab Isolate" /LENGTH=1227 /DNA_ID=CAMNT_0027577415 /DNA_START=45 /DNA_END=3728 /DNA_ORIENTATION=+